MFVFRSHPGCPSSEQIDKGIMAQRLFENGLSVRFKDSDDFRQRPLQVQMMKDARAADLIEGIVLEPCRLDVHDLESRAGQALGPCPLGGQLHSDLLNVYSRDFRAALREIEGIGPFTAAVFKNLAAAEIRQDK